MTEDEVLIAIAALREEEQIAWMLRLGAALTITARCFYPFEANPGSIQGLMGVNEIQHRLFARIRDLSRGHEWTIESFVRMTFEMASIYGLSGEIGWALSKSLETSNSAPIN